MLLIILGAGASFDSIHPRMNPKPYASLGNKGRPPLAKDLFNPREDYQGILNSYPKAKLVVPEIRRRLASNEDMESILQSIYSSPYMGRKEAISSIRYYLRALLRNTSGTWYANSDGLTNYHNLVDFILNFTGNQDVYIVSFNYDEMLEGALTDVVGLKFNKIDDYINNKKIKLIKPHGSIRWVQKFNPKSGLGNWISHAIENVDEIDLLDEYSIDDSGVPINGYPLISVPVLDKTDFSCPPSHLKVLESALPDITHLLTIGWRGREKHFTSRFLSSLNPVNLHSVGSSEVSARETVENLKLAGVRNKGFVAYPLKGFSDFVYEERWIKSFLG